MSHTVLHPTTGAPAHQTIISQCLFCLLSWHPAKLIIAPIFTDRIPSLSSFTRMKLLFMPLVLGLSFLSLTWAIATISYTITIPAKSTLSLDWWGPETIQGPDSLSFNNFGTVDPQADGSVGKRKDEGKFTVTDTIGNTNFTVSHWSQIHWISSLEG